jgi:copper chaperone
MKIKYELEGMSCGGCVSNVKRALLQVPNVTEAEVTLNPQSAILTMINPIGIDELQAQLTKVGQYTIKEVVSNLSI